MEHEDCQDCNEADMHPCPFQQDVHNDQEFTCHCCEKHEQDCRDDI